MTATIEDRSGAAPASALLALIDQISAGAPYHYQPGEIPPAAEWFTPLVGKPGARTCVALDAGRPVGFCLALPLSEYADARHEAAVAVEHPDTAVYLAELGIDAGYRRQGIAGRLLACTTAHAADREVVVRTLVGNDPAVALYRRHGYHVVDAAGQSYRGRERLFLVRPPTLPSRSTCD